MKRIAIGFLCALLLVANNIKAQSPDLKWAGINGNTGFHTDVPFVTEANKHVNALQLGIVRMGMDAIGGRNPSDSFSWADRDRTVNSHLGAGTTIHATLSPNAHVDKGSNNTDWKNNYRNFCRNIFARYKGKISYYILENEPDLKGAAFTPQLCVEMAQIAFEEARKVDATIRIESAPTSSAGKGYLRDMIDLGVTRYCDVIGVHTYSSQIDDQHGENIGKPWEFMMAANAASGYPIRPVASSESGTSSNWTPSGLDGRVWQARWFRQAWIAHKRWGYDNLLLYSLTRSGAGESWNIATWNGSALIPYQPTYDAIKSAYDLTPFANGNFESANDRELGWAINTGMDQATPFEWGRITFPTNDASNSRNGIGHCRMNMEGNAPGGAINTRRVRRVAETLTPNTLYTVTAYAKITGGGTATLKVQGFDTRNGSKEVSASTSTTGSWQKLEVSFTPNRTWGVITLEGTGTGAGRIISWDDVSITAAGGAPDLVVTDIGWSPASPAVGTALTFSATIKNQGSGATPAGVVHGVGFVVDGTKVSWSDNSTAALAAGASRTVTATGPLYTLTAGTHTVEAFVDDVDRIKNESNETNNKLTETLAPSTSTFSGVYRLVARHSGKVLDVDGASGGSTANGAVVHQWGWLNQTNQQWKIEAAGAGAYTLTAQHSGKCLDVNEASTADGANVQQWDYLGRANQQWKIEATSEGYYRLVNVASGKALDISGGPSATANGALAIQHTYSGGTNQQWKLEKVAATASREAAEPTAATSLTPDAASVVSLSAFPNPSSGPTTLALEAKEAQRVTVYVHNSQGNLVSLLTVPCQQGHTDFKLPTDLSTGTYFLRALIDGQKQQFTLKVQ